VSKDDYARAVIAEGQRRKITPRGIVIALATCLVESELTMYANAKVPESMLIPHEAVGDDGMSVGLFQQQIRKGPTGEWWWADAATCMDPTKSAGLFYGRLVRVDYNGRNSPGSYAQAVQSSSFPDRYDKRMADAQTIYDRLTTGAQPVTDPNRPDFNEVNQIGYDAANPHGSVRSRPPINFFIHTQEGDGNATDLAAYLRSTSGNSAVSYHYTIREDTGDHGVTVVDVIDTDLYAWAVLNANVFSINLCFAGSRAAWTRDQWLQQGRAIDVAAYLAVQDCKKYKMPTEVLAPPYAGAARGGISDHKYVTQKLGIGNHTDVGNNFPWDVFAAAVKKYTDADLPPVVSPPVTPPSAPAPKPVGPADDQITLRWNALGGQTVVEALAEIRDKVTGSNDRTKTGAK
jgi:N-acetyl-anhydromuramyl-L-alanine amidase AmpD